MKKLTLWLSAALIGVLALSSRPVATQSTSTNSIVLFADAYDLDSTTTIYCDTGATYPTGTVAACSTGSAAGDGWITVSGYGNVAVIVDVDAVDNNITVVVEARYRNASPVTTDTITIADAFTVISAAGTQTFVLNVPADQIRVGVSVAAGGEGTDEDLEVIVYRSFNGLTAGLSSGGGAAIASGSGTANTVVKFDASGDLEDSQITDDGTTLDMTVADLQFTNNGTITSDVNMFINATSGGTGVMLISANRTQNIAASPAANTDIYEWIQTLPITAAGQTTNVLKLELTNADHTGGTVNGLLIAGITGDAQATENAVNFSDGWDVDIEGNTDLSISATTVSITQGELDVLSSLGYVNVNFTENATFSIKEKAVTSNTTIQMDGASGGILSLISGEVGHTAAQIIYQASSPVANAPFVQVVDTIPITAAGQTTDVLFFDLVNSNHTGGVVNAINIEAITGDAQAVETGILLGAGWDSGILFDDDLTDYITFEDGNGSFRNHTSPGYYIMPNGVHQVGGDTNGSTLGAVADNVRVWREYIPYRLTVSRIAWSINTGGAAGAECSAGIYNSDGTTLLIDSGAQVCTGTGAFDIDVTDVTIGPGFYLFAVTADDATVAWEVDTDPTPDSGKGALYNATVVQVGGATNVSANAVLPATTGVLVGVNVRATAIIKLQG